MCQEITSDDESLQTTDERLKPSVVLSSILLDLSSLQFVGNRFRDSNIIGSFEPELPIGRLLSPRLSGQDPLTG